MRLAGWIQITAAVAVLLITIHFLSGIKDLDDLISRFKDNNDQALARQNNSVPSLRLLPVRYPRQAANRSGVIVLGMHRSGTSLLTGLLTRMGLNVGDNLIGGAPDNLKGFFERSDMVLQNDEFFISQKMFFDHDSYKFDFRAALRDIALKNLNATGEKFVEGRKTLAFVNNQSNHPYVLKDPRLCITLRTWLTLFNHVPAVVFTYRHPVDVARSLMQRHDWMDMSRALRIWYVNNRMALQQSSLARLCRVMTSHNKLMKNPDSELHSIFMALRTRCRVNVPHPVDPTIVATFMDANLQHGNMTLQEDFCNNYRNLNSHLRTNVKATADSLENITTGNSPSMNRMDSPTESNSVINAPPLNIWNTTNPEDIYVYNAVMQLYCSLEDGTAYLPSFKWDMSIHD